MTGYLRAGNLPSAIEALGSREASVLAGGTDWYPARVGRPLDTGPVVDIGGIAELHGIRDEGEVLRIGALTTWSDLLAAPLPAWLDGYRQAAREVGGRQVQNVGTLAGNLCNASPAADGTPNLLALDASVELVSTRGTRRLPVAEFVTGNRRTLRAPDELVTALLVPKLPDAARSVFLKLGARRYLVISIVMVSVVLVPGTDGRVADARVAVGACSAVPVRLPALESALAGRRIDATLGAAATLPHLDPLAPIDDVRASAGYRTDATLTLVRRALNSFAA